MVEPWLQITIGIATLFSIFFGAHMAILKRSETKMKEFERRTNERIEHVIDNRLNPVVRSLEAVSEKLANGINTAVAANKDNIAGMRIEFANLTGQLEHLLSDYHPKEKT